MNSLDWVVIVIYVLVLCGVAGYTFSKQKTSRDYYLAGGKLKGAASGLSLLANQVSAISLIGAPAFIAVREGGGLFWLQYELAVPLAMVILILLSRYLWSNSSSASVYEIIGVRYGAGLQKLLALVFAISRGLATSVALLATGYVTAASFGISLTTALITVGVVSLLYSSIGGLEADVISDLLQLVILWGSALFTIGFLLMNTSIESLSTLFDHQRLDTVRFDGSTFSFWPMLLGGFFLYISYYGFDQSQAQRILATRSDYERNRAYWFNGMLRFPLVLTYSFVGVLMILFLQQEPDFAAKIAGLSPNELMPSFFTGYLPPGLLGLVTAGIFAAAMSSLDSAIGALSAITWSDILAPVLNKKRGKDLTSPWAGRFITLLWGVVIVAVSLVMSRTESTVLEMVNKIGSLFYGPVAAVFIATVPGKIRSSLAGAGALAAGLGVNVILWLFFESSISWLWWNFTGFAVTWIFLWFTPYKRAADIIKEKTGGRRVFILSLTLFFITILVFVLLLNYAV